LKIKTPIHIIIILLYSLNSFSQSKITSVKVNYEFIMGLTNKTYRSVAELQIGNRIATYIVLNNQKEENSDDFKYDKKSDSYNKEIDLSDGSGMYMKINLMDSTLIHTSNIGKTKYLIHESLPVMNWKLEEGEKEINDFICKKATLNFRGRDYIAWYNPKIPVPFGPWKFTGLPGLIMEISDLDNKYSWAAKKIITAVTFNENDIDKKKYKSVSLKQYIALQDKSSEDFKKMMLSKVPKGAMITNFKMENNSIETKYEWQK